jgi:hypothetical protein
MILTGTTYQSKYANHMAVENCGRDQGLSIDPRFAIKPHRCE